MSKVSKIFQPLMALILVIGLLAPVTTPSSVPASIQPTLAEMMAADPSGSLRVIVQKVDSSDQAEQIVEALGGTILSELGIINAFAAEMPGGAIDELARSSAVGRVSLDAPMVSTGGKPEDTAIFDLLDSFSTTAYNNNDGLAIWATDWIEDDVTGSGPIDGKVYISEGELYLHGDSDLATQPSLAREADLSKGVTSATLTFSYRAAAVAPSGYFDNSETEEKPVTEEEKEAYILQRDFVVLEISSDGGASYAYLWGLENLHDSAGEMSVTAPALDISNYVSANTRLRFRVQSGYSDEDEYFAVDDVRIEYEGTALPNNHYLDTLNVQPVWDMGFTGQGIGVAVVDSGISQDRDFNSLQKSSFNPDSTTVNDVYGHGTHVAGIIAGNGRDSGGHFMGIAPDIDLFSLKVSDETGMAYESDTVEALQWVYENKDRYNIRVVNLSIQSTVEQAYNDSALNAAAEILWLNDVVVVAASGNWSEGDFNPIYAAPANDPFIITVGATNEKGTSRLKDDAVATFSADGETQDFYIKPEIYAPGKDIISVLSNNSSWDSEHPDRVVHGGQYFRISGTSMSAPMVSGAAALLLQAEPDLTPDQVKYRLIHASNSVSNNPYLDIYAALTTPTTESANEGVVPHMLLARMAMIAYWSSQNGEENVDWENVDWAAVNWNAVNWNAVNWNAVNWNAVNWNAVNWNAVNWNAVNWNAVNWNAVNWNAVSWLD